jgi:hypothetical protein
MTRMNCLNRPFRLRQLALSAPCSGVLIVVGVLQFPFSYVNSGCRAAKVQKVSTGSAITVEPSKKAFANSMPEFETAGCFEKTKYSAYFLSCLFD